eukprot:3876361-Rhodomonas_salina.1
MPSSVMVVIVILPPKCCIPWYLQPSWTLIPSRVLSAAADLQSLYLAMDFRKNVLITMGSHCLIVPDFIGKYAGVLIPPTGSL